LLDKGTSASSARAVRTAQSDDRRRFRALGSLVRGNHHERHSFVAFFGFSSYFGVVIKAVTLLVALAVVPSSGGYKTFSGGGVSFRYPATWHVQRESVQGLHAQPIAALGNGAVHASCSATAEGFTCGWPVEQLAPGDMAVLVSARHTGGAVRWPMRVAGHGASVLMSRPGGCAEIGGDLTIDASVQVGRTKTVRVLACAKSPGLERSRQVAMRLLRSLKNG
jgi:hypothetical protein